MNDVEIQRKIDVILTLLSERKLNNIPKLEEDVIEYLSELNRIFDDDVKATDFCPITDGIACP